MIVMKFGGSSVANAQRIRNITRIVKSRLANKPVVVVSALGGVTDAILDCAAQAANEENYVTKLTEIIKRHHDTIDELGLSPDIIKSELNQLKEQLGNIGTDEDLAPKTLDSISSFGERMSARIIAGHMSSVGLNATAHDSYDIGLITDSNFGDADVLSNSYPKMKMKLSKIRTLPVITGFVGKDKSGNITTLGRGGSDYTASIIGAAIGAKEIQIWTDVNGIMTADPRIVKNAKSVPVVSYDEASELAFLGAKVLHPKTILPAINQNIPVKILNTFNPKHKGTIVLRNIKTRSRIASITCKKRIQVINLTNPQMFQSHGFLRKVFEIFDNHGVAVDMVSTSEINISITVDGKQQTDKLVQELGNIAQVQLKSNRAKVSMVGKDMAHMSGVMGKLFSSLNGIAIEMVSSSTSEINQSFVVEEKDADRSVIKLHNAFFGR